MHNCVTLTNTGLLALLAFTMIPMAGRIRHEHTRVAVMPQRSASPAVTTLTAADRLGMHRENAGVVQPYMHLRCELLHQASNIIMLIHYVYPLRAPSDRSGRTRTGSRTSSFVILPRVLPGAHCSSISWLPE